MKNRKTILIAFLVCACIVVGVGYANLTDDLTITGKGQLSYENANEEFKKDVYFSEVVSRTNCTAVIDATDPDKDKIAITIDDTTSAMAVQGNTATAVLKIANATTDEVTVTVTSPTNATSDYFDIKIEGGDTFTIEPGTNVDGSINPFLKDITVVITLKQTINADMLAPETFTLDLNAVSGS